MATDASYGSLPFDEAVKFFRQKVNVPSAKWADILEGAHTRAFTVAGATKEGLLTDFRAAIDKAIATGTTLDEFRKDFDGIVEKHGWDYKGTRGWRTRTIYETNLRTAYGAGRWQQMTDPDVARMHPYWRYRHSDAVKHPRPEHLAWNGVTLEVSDPWWKTHYPPNGWGCQCTVEPVTRREMGARKPDAAPAIKWEKKELTTSGGKIAIDVPKGIDPGWGYNVGEAAFGWRYDKATLDAYEKTRDAWERQTPGDWQSWKRPERVPHDKPRASLGRPARNAEDMRALVERAIGGAEALYETPAGTPVYVNGEALAAHLAADDKLGRGIYLPFLPETITDPNEVWISFERHSLTGQVRLRQRIVKVIDAGKVRGLLLVAEASDGRLVGITFMPGANPETINRSWRVGRLLWGR